MTEEIKQEEQKEEVKTYTQEEVDELVSGLKNKRDELLGKTKQYKEKLKEFEGVDVERIREVQKQLEDKEEKELLDKGGIDAVIAKRLERMKTDYEKEKQAALQRAEKLAEKSLASTIMSVAGKANAHSSAFEDINHRAKSVFEADADGEIVAKEGLLDKNGKPLTIEAWMGELQDEAPHLFSAPQGGGLGNGRTAPATQKRSQMSAEEKHAYIQKHGQQAFLKLPK